MAEKRGTVARIKEGVITFTKPPVNQTPPSQRQPAPSPKKG